MEFLIELAAKKFWPPARARRKGGGGGIPPRPSVPPERSGGGQFPSKKVRAKCMIAVPPRGVEPLFQAPQARVLSIERRGRLHWRTCPPQLASAREGGGGRI